MLHPRNQCQHEKQGQGSLRFHVIAGASAVSNDVAACNESIPIEIEESEQKRKEDKTRDWKKHMKQALLAADVQRKQANAAKVRESLLQRKEVEKVIEKDSYLKVMYGNIEVAELKSVLVVA